VRKALFRKKTLNGATQSAPEGRMTNEPSDCTSPHLEIQTVKWKLKTAKKHWEKQRWLVIYNGMVDPRSARNIAKHVGVSKGFVHKVIQRYNSQGEEALKTQVAEGDATVI
jgi:hypothetical protein